MKAKVLKRPIWPKETIKALFEAHHGETLYPSDISDELGIDYETVTRLLSELQQEGRIKEATRAK